MSEPSSQDTVELLARVQAGDAVAQGEAPIEEERNRMITSRQGSPAD